jgi:integrase
MAAARDLPSPSQLRADTTVTIIGLLWSTGIRIGEVLSLNVGDVDFDTDVVTVRHGKFGKTRLLPVRRSTAEKLQQYLNHPRRRVDRQPDSPFMVSMRRRRLSYAAFNKGFRTAVESSGVAGPGAIRAHDLRHTFVVRRVAAWYADGADVNAWLPALSTYLGHVGVESTCSYLRVNGILLDHANHLFEKHTSGLDGGAS